MVAVLSDIHGNLEAFNKVIDYLLKRNIEEIYILGDIVDYGADSVEVIKKVVSLKREGFKIHCCRGNHEDAIINPHLSKFNTDHAKASIEITEREIFSSNSVEGFFFLSHFPSISTKLKDKNFTFIHGSKEDIIHGDYGKVKKVVPGQSYDFSNFSNFVFGGHTHIQGIKTLDRYTIYLNPGSVGQPRNGDYRAQFMTINESMSKVKFLRLEYDAMSASMKILKSGRPHMLSTRILFGA